MSIRKCCICDKDIRIGYGYFCPEHWKMYKDRRNEPWLRFLINSEQKERNYARKTSGDISLDSVINYEDKN